MPAYKITKKVRSKRLILDLPLNLQSKELEITIQPVKNIKKRNGKVKPLSSYMGILKKRPISQVDKEIEQLRKEWERDF